MCGRTAATTDPDDLVLVAQEVRLRRCSEAAAGGKGGFYGKGAGRGAGKGAPQESQQDAAAEPADASHMPPRSPRAIAPSWARPKHVRDDQIFISPKFNAAPTSWLPVLTPIADGGVELSFQRWGGGPGSGGLSRHNARTDALGKSPLWSSMLAAGGACGPASHSCRCIIVVDGFFEWQAPVDGAAAKKTPYFIAHSEARPLGQWRGALDRTPAKVGAGKEKVAAAVEKEEVQEAVVVDSDTNDAAAAVSERAISSTVDPPHAVPQRPWPERSIAAGRSPLFLAGLSSGGDCTIVTMESVGTPVEEVHDRMPLFLSPGTARLWLWDDEKQWRQGVEADDAKCESPSAVAGDGGGLHLRRAARETFVAATLKTCRTESVAVARDALEMRKAHPNVGQVKLQGEQCLWSPEQVAAEDKEAKAKTGIARFFDKPVVKA